MTLIGYFESCDYPSNMSHPLPSHENETIVTEFMFFKSFGELIGQLFVIENSHCFNFKLFNICSEEVVRNGNVFGSRIYLRDCGKFKTCIVIFMEYGSGNCSKQFVNRTVFSMYLGIFDDYRVDFLKQFTDTNQFMHG